MKPYLGLIGAILGALLAVFYFGSLASDYYVANRTFESPEDVNTHHSAIYLVTLIVSITVGWALARLVGRIIYRGDL